MTRLGKFSDPFNDLRAALENPNLRGGHTVYLRAGTHPLTADTTITTAGITVRPYASERAAVDLLQGDLFCLGPQFILRDVTILSSDTDRTGEANTTVPAGGVNIRAPLTMINVQISAARLVGWWSESVGVWRGVLSQDIGYDATDRGHGHALYVQNAAANGEKRLEACILVNGFSYSLHAYGEGAADLENIHLVDCIIMNEKALVGGGVGTSVDAVTMDNCAVYAPLRMGYEASANRSANITNSLLRRLTIQQTWENLAVSGCTFLSGSAECVQLYEAADYSGLRLDNNVYVTSSATPFGLYTAAGALKTPFTFAQWKTVTGQDTNSRFYPSIAAAVSAGDLVVPVVRVFPVNEGRHVANIAIWNPLQDASASVDLSALGMANGRYELRQVRDYTGDVRAFTYSGRAVNVSMSGTTKWPPGYPTPYHPEAVPANALPTFGAFELWAV